VLFLSFELGNARAPHGHERLTKVLVRCFPIKRSRKRWATKRDLAPQQRI
jgi:hypothetical protein